MLPEPLLLESETSRVAINRHRPGEHKLHTLELEFLLKHKKPVKKRYGFFAWNLLTLRAQYTGLLILLLRHWVPVCKLPAGPQPQGVLPYYTFG